MRREGNKSRSAIVTERRAQSAECVNEYTRNSNSNELTNHPPQIQRQPRRRRIRRQKTRCRARRVERLEERLQLLLLLLLLLLRLWARSGPRQGTVRDRVVLDERHVVRGARVVEGGGAFHADGDFAADGLVLVSGRDLDMRRRRRIRRPGNERKRDLPQRASRAKITKVWWGLRRVDGACSLHEIHTHNIYAVRNPISHMRTRRLKTNR